VTAVKFKPTVGKLAIVHAVVPKDEVNAVEFVPTATKLEMPPYATAFSGTDTIGATVEY